MDLPEWINTELYPFEPKSFETGSGTMSYVDEGDGPVVLFLHGNPTWSFMYRKAIRRLRDDYRCVAPDHLGFGLSDKPAGWSYRPWDHSKNVRNLLDHLEVDEFSLVVHDWGGPIGLSVALEDPGRLSTLTVLNTWMWRVSDRLDAWMFSTLLGSWLGQYLIEDWDLFTDLLMKWGVSQPDALVEEVHSQYRGPFLGNGSKQGVWQFPSDIVGSDEWLKDLWEEREKLVDTPTLVQWGMKDPAFDKHELNRWIELLNDAEIKRYADGSHYLMEDHGDAVSEELAGFLSSRS